MVLVSPTHKTTIIHSNRQQKVLDYALDQIQSSTLMPYINAIYLYGSCARRQEHWDSDVERNADNRWFLFLNKISRGR